MKKYFNSKLFKKIFTQENKGLLKNLTSLGFIQATNFLLPLVVIPHLVIVLGIEKFGLVSFAQVIVLYFVIFSEYGFNFTATKDISLYRNDKEKLSYIYNYVITSRIFLSVIGLIVLSLIVFLIPQLRKDWPLYIFSSTMFFGQSLVPVWFFLGIEQMKFITFFNLISKLIFTIFTFVLIQKPDHYIYANMLHGLGSLGAGVVSMFVVRYRYKIRFGICSIKEVKNQLKGGFPIFISTLTTNIYMNINIVILGFVSTVEVVGVFSIAEKVFIAGKHFVSVIFQTIYPYACKLKDQSEERLMIFFTKFAYLNCLLFLLFGAFTYYFAPEIIELLAGTKIESSILILRQLSFVPLIMAITVPAYQTNLIYEFKKSFSFVLSSASLLNVLANFILASKFDATGTVVAIIITEIYVMVALNINVFIKSGLAFYKPSNIWKEIKPAG